MISKEDRKRKIINKRPLVLPDEVNGVTVDNISKRKESRMRLIKRELKKYIDKPLYCPALKEHIHITKDSIVESKWQGRFDKKGAYLVINLPLVIKHASFLKRNPSKDDKRQKKMKLVEMIVLSTPIKGIGFAKLCVGKNEINNCVHYSLTKMTIEELREE